MDENVRLLFKSDMRGLDHVGLPLAKIMYHRGTIASGIAEAMERREERQSIDGLT